MNQEEFKENKRLAEFQFENRCNRLLEKYRINAPQQMIDEELSLIREAGERIRLLGEISRGANKTAEFTGHVMARQAISNSHSDEILQEEEVYWNELKLKIVTNLSFDYNDSQLSGLVDDAVSAFRQNGNFMLLKTE